MSRTALGPPPARRSCVTRGRLPRGVGSSHPWSSVWPSTGSAGHPSHPAFIADPATVADAAWPSRRAGPCPRLRLRAAPLPALVSLTARPRRPGYSRAMNSGKTVTHDGQGGQPRSLRRTHQNHTGLRILESGGFWKPQEGAYADIEAMNLRTSFTSFLFVFLFPFLFLFLFLFNVPLGQE
jgi:hypothetical protein